MLKPAAVIPDRLRQLLLEKDISQAGLARELGVSQATIARLALGNSFGSKHLHSIARVLGTSPAYLTGQTDNPEEGAAVMPSLDEVVDQFNLVQLEFLDLKFGMGGGTELDDYVERKLVSVSREWVEAFSKTDPKFLFIAMGVGDSMQPTIYDGDLLLCDRSQMTPRMSDQIWAITYYGGGMVKRLRFGPEGSYKILSDNASVPPEMASDGEMTIIGRVIAVMRRL